MILKFYKTISLLANLEYKAIHRTKYFGLLWKFLNPLIFIFIYTFVFSTLTSRGSRGFVISLGILLFSGITTSLNSSTHWVQEKLVHFLGNKKSLRIYFISKIYFNFLPIFYLLPVMILIQRFLFNKDFKFTIIESIEILIGVFVLTLICMFYCYIISIPIAIFSKKLSDLQDLVTHILRISTYLSPIIWSAKTGNLLVDYILQLINPFYFIFEALNNIIYRSYDFSYITLITPFLLVFMSYIYFYRKSKYISLLAESIFK